MSSSEVSEKPASGHQHLQRQERDQSGRRSHEETLCCQFFCVTPKEDPLEFSSCLSILLLILGILLVSFGYLVPRQYSVDYSLTARENESNAIYYYRLGKQMDVCILVGITTLSVGSILLSIVLSYTLYKSERAKTVKAADELAK